MDNQVSDRLANGALDRHRSRFECVDHGTRPTTCPTTAPQNQPAPALRHHSRCSDCAKAAPYLTHLPTAGLSATGPDAVLEARPRLRLRKITAKETAMAAKLIEMLAHRLQTRLREATAWAEGEGLVCAIAPAIYDALCHSRCPCGVASADLTTIVANYTPGP
ncbi:reverse transcriptase [Phytophthora cinnamomi]|uniref:reverse transcriptase n=1 Tax=Phytophthora cinnamomi TaxID=4785 RepID=UPI003559CA69|nr:reverse transcriptase [Phytophthora cinnamomi]